MKGTKGKLPVNVLPADMPAEELALANKVRAKRQRQAILGLSMKKAPEGDDVTMVSAYQDTQMLRSEKLLHEAAKLNRTEVVVKLLAKGIGVNCTNNLDRTPIQWAAAHGAKEVIMVLLSHDANLESEDKYGMRPSLWAAWFGHVDVLKFLFACGAKPDCTNRQGLNILHCAASQNRVEVIDYILQNIENFDLDVEERQGRTALHIAASEGNARAVVRLLSVMKPENVRVRDKHEQTPLLSACSAGDVGCVEALLEAGSEINAKNGEGKTALHLAAEHGHANVCELLLKFPDSIQSVLNTDEKKDREFERFSLHDEPFDEKHLQTAMHLCVSGGHSRTASVLASNGCNINAENAYGDTPLHLAARLSDESTIVQLSKNGAFINKVNYRFQTPLHVAVEVGNIDSVNVLLSLGANATAQEKNGRTPLYMATRGSFTDIVDLIIRAELRTDTCDENHATGMDYSMKDDISMKRSIKDDISISKRSIKDDISLKPSIRDDVSIKRNGDVKGLENVDIIDERIPVNSTHKMADDPTHPHGDLIKPILHKLAHKQLHGAEWKRLAKFLNFSYDHVKAIEHHYDGKYSYRNHGYRMLLIWLKGQRPSDNPTVQLCQGLEAIGKNRLADEIKRKILMACGEDEVSKKRCVIS